MSGFPAAGTGAGTSSWQGQAHNTAALISGLALDGASIVFALRFTCRGQHAWAAYSIAAVAADLAAAGMAAATGDFRWLLLGGAVTWTWASAISQKLLHEHATGDGTGPPAHQKAASRSGPCGASGSNLTLGRCRISDRRRDGRSATTVG